MSNEQDPLQAMHHVNLAAGTIVAAPGGWIKVKDMDGDWSTFERVRRDGQRDKRYDVGWSGRLDVTWPIVTAKVRG